jgi:CMP-2-keto-3-deoxyoctulosonic acid synthetase
MSQIAEFDKPTTAKAASQLEQLKLLRRGEAVKSQVVFPDMEMGVKLHSIPSAFLICL